MRARAWLLVWAFLVLLPIAACTSGRNIALPAQAPTVDVTMREMRFDFKAGIPNGRVMFRIRNAGSIDHRLILVPLPDDFPPLSEQLKLDVTDRRRVSPLAGIPDLAPGMRDSFAVDLAPGRYGFVCLYVDADGVSHANKGMGSEFRVQPSGA